MLVCIMLFFIVLPEDETNLFSNDKHYLQIIRLFLYIKEHHGIQTAFQFLGNVIYTNIYS